MPLRPCSCKMAEMVANAYRKGDIGSVACLCRRLYAQQRSRAESLSPRTRPTSGWKLTQEDQGHRPTRSGLYGQEMTEPRPSRMLAEAQAQMVADDAAEVAQAQQKQQVSMNYPVFARCANLLMTQQTRLKT